MIDVLLRVHATNEVHGPFESWAEVLSCARDLRARGVGEVTVYRENLVCDFCSDPHPAWDYEAEDSLLMAVGARGGAPEIHLSRGSWTACDPCHELIEADEWGDMLLRSAEGFTARHSDLGLSPAVVGQFIAQAHATFRSTRTGAPPSRIPSDEELLG
jgi:hypothetical protein